MFRKILTNKLFLAACLISVLMGCSSSPPSVLVDDSIVADVYVLSEAVYLDGENISTGARVECDLEKTVVGHFVNFSDDYGFSAAARTTDQGEENLVKIEIARLLAGKASLGFGGRWVVSEMEVIARLGDKSTYQTCSAGLGVNPLGNIKACDRLERCSKQLGEKIARWVSKRID